MLQTITLSPGVTLRCYTSDRFKHACLSVQFVDRMRAPTAAENALVPAVLLRGCESAPDLRAVTARLDRLYGASLGVLVRRAGDCQCVGLYTRFVEDCFAIDGEEILRPMLGLIGELLLHPRTEGGCFLDSFVESERKNLLAAIDAERNDKRAYAAAQLLRRMCRADSYGVARLGERAQAEQITAKSAYARYRALLETCPVDLFYVGSAPPERVGALLAPLFAAQDRWEAPAAPAPFADAGGGTWTETLPLTQSRICMGFLTPITTAAPAFAAMQLANAVFGGGMTSKLFQNVREKMSACYDIDSAYYGAKGIVTVCAGIDAAQRGAVEAEIARCLAECAAGNITADELEQARQTLISSLRGTCDAPGSIERYYSTAARTGLRWTPQEYMDALTRVTAADVADAAGSVRLHSTYFLEGAEA